MRIKDNLFKDYLFMDYLFKDNLFKDYNQGLPIHGFIHSKRW